MLQPRAGLRFFIAFLLVVTLILVLRMGKTGITFREEPYFLGLWGEETGQFGRVLALDGSQLGPDQMAVYDDRLLVADPGNERIVLYEIRGSPQWLRAWELPAIAGVRSISYWLHELVVQDDRSDLHRFTNGAWKPLGTQTAAPPDAVLILGSGMGTTKDALYYAMIWLTAGGETWQLWCLEPALVPRLIITWSDATADLAHEALWNLDGQVYGSVLDFAVSARGDILVQVMERESLSTAFLLFNEARESWKTVTIPAAQAALPQLVGLDRWNNIYLVTGDELVVYRHNGERLGQLVLPPAKRRRSITLDEAGNVYVLAHASEGVELTCYRRVKTGRIWPVP